MLSFLRRGVKSWVAKVLLALLILSFAVWGIGDIFLGRSATTVAMVGDTEVTSEQFARAIQRQQNLLIRQRGEAIDLATMRAAGLDRRELGAMIRDAAFSEELTALEIAVPADSVREAIEATPAFQDGAGTFSQSRYQSALIDANYATAEWEYLMRNTLGQQILQDAVAPTLEAAPGTAQLIAAWQGERRAVRALTLPESLAADPGTPEDAILTAFFEENSDDFIEPERRWGHYLHVDVAALTDELTPTPEEIRAEYDTRPETYAIAATRTVEQIVFDDRPAADAAARRIAEESATFEEIAIEQNLALESLALGTVGQEDLPEVTADAVFALTEPGIAGPVDGPFGPVLLNVTGVVIGGPVPFEEVRDQITAALAAERARDAAPERANQIDDLRAGGTSLEEISAETGLELKPIDGLDRLGRPAAGEQPAIAADPRFLRDLSEAIDGEERDIVQLSDGGYALVMIERIEESHLPDFATVREKVVETWSGEQRLQSLEVRAAAANLDALATETGTEFEEIEAFLRTAPPPTLSAELVELVFTANEGDFVTDRSRDGGSVIVAEVTAVTPLDEEALTEQTARAAEGLGQSLSRDHLDYFGQALLNRYPAQVNEETINMIFEQLGGHGG